MARRYIGTEDLVGATVVKIEYDEVILESEKDGRKFILSIESEEQFDSMKECNCWCSCSSYFRAEEDE